MTDHNTRQRQRQHQAHPDDPHARAAHLAARMRRESELPGMPWPERLNLAAYCGDAGARLLITDELAVAYQVIDRDNLSDWLTGLQRYPKSVMIRAAVAAARVVLRALEQADSLEWDAGANQYVRVPGGPVKNSLFSVAVAGVLFARRAIEAAEAWLADPTEANRGEPATTVVSTGSGDWWTQLPGLIQGAPCGPAIIQAAARALGTDGEPTVRAAICAELVEWVTRVKALRLEGGSNV